MKDALINYSVTTLLSVHFTLRFALFSNAYTLHTSHFLRKDAIYRVCTYFTLHTSYCDPRAGLTHTSYFILHPSYLVSTQAYRVLNWHMEA